MIRITIYAQTGDGWSEQLNFTRPVSGEDKLDETLDSAITMFTKQAEKNKLPPFNKVKIVADDGQGAKTLYFVVATPDSDKARMGE